MPQKRKIRATSATDDAGYSRIAKQPKRLAPHNQVTWTKFENLIERNGGKADFDQLTAAARGHRHYGKDASNPRLFVRYCLRKGWLGKMADS